MVRKREGEVSLDRLHQEFSSPLFRVDRPHIRNHTPGCVPWLPVVLNKICVQDSSLVWPDSSREERVTYRSHFVLHYQHIQVPDNHNCFDCYVRTTKIKIHKCINFLSHGVVSLKKKRPLITEA